MWWLVAGVQACILWSAVWARRSSRGQPGLADQLQAGGAPGSQGLGAAPTRASEQLLLESTLLGIWTLDTQARTLAVNPAMCTLLGRPRDELIGHSAFDYFQGPDLDTLHRESAARRKGKKGGYEIGITRPDGSRVICINHATPIFDAAGQQTGSVGMWADVTALRMAEHDLRIFEAMINAITDWVSVMDADRTYRVVNDAWLRGTGLTREQVLNKPIDSVPLPFRSAMRDQALRTCIRDGTTQRVRAISNQPGVGVNRHMETTYYPFFDNATKARRVILVTRDVTEQEQDRLAAAASADYLRGTLNATGDAIFASEATDPHQPVRFVNAQMLQMWGIDGSKAESLTPADIMTHAMQLFRHPAEQAALVSDIIAQERADESQVELRDGRVLLRRCIPAKISGHSVRVWSFRDITAEQRALADAQDRDADLRSLLDAFPGFITRIDEDYVYTYANEQVAQRLGLKPADMVGRTVDAVAGAERSAWLRPFFDRALAGELVTYERHHDRPNSDGLTDQVTLALGVDHRNGRPAVYTFGIDITDRKRAEAAMQAAKNSADRANRLKSEFLANMSHEIRTPMNGVLGMIELVQATKLTDSQQERLQVAYRSGEALLVILNDILDFSKIEAGRLDLHPVDFNLRTLVDELIELLHNRCDEKNLALDLCWDANTPALVHGDDVRLRQVLTNLLGNAIKFTPAGRVTLTVSVQPQGIGFAVQDTGVGIPIEQQASVFDAFTQADGSITRQFGGTGLGLSISNQLVRLMGGQLALTSQPGRGSEFRFVLDLPRAAEHAITGPARASSAEPANRAGPTGHSDPATARNLSILLVEDNAINQMVASGMLEWAGHRVVVVDSGAEAVRRVACESFDLALMDMQMPEMDGPEAAERIRSQERALGQARMPIIALTASAFEADRAICMKAGMDDFLTKPLHQAALVAAINRAVAAGPLVTTADH